MSRVKTRHSSSSSPHTVDPSAAEDDLSIKFHVPPALLDICICVNNERPPPSFELCPRDINATAVGGGTTVRIGKKLSPPLGLCDQLFEAKTLDYVPKKNSGFVPAFDLPAAELPSFCFPAGGARLLYKKGRNAPIPSIFYFTFTGIDGSSSYASGLLFHERLDVDVGEDLMRKFDGVWGSCDSNSEDGSEFPLRTPSLSSISQEQLRALALVARSLKDNLSIKDRVYHLKTYPDCFLGVDAITHVAKTLCEGDRAAAVEKLNDVVQAGFIAHVTSEHLLEDGEHLFFRFTGDAAGDEVGVFKKDFKGESWRTWFSPRKTSRRSLSGKIEKNSRTESKPRETHRLYKPIVLVVLSRHPLFRAFSSFLSQLYQISLSPTSPVPLERHITAFLQHIPRPVASGQPFHLHLDMLLIPQSQGIPVRASTLAPIVLPPPSSAALAPPLLDLDFISIFRTLSISNILRVFTVLLREGRVLLLSSCGAVLAEVAEIFRALLFPLKWQCCFVPRLPEALLGALEAPGGYLIGLLTSKDIDDSGVARMTMGGLGSSSTLDHLIRRQLREGVCVVCLDDDAVIMGDVKEKDLADVISKTVGGASGDVVHVDQNEDSIRESEVGKSESHTPAVNISTPSSVTTSLTSPAGGDVASPAVGGGLKFAQDFKPDFKLSSLLFNDGGPRLPRRVTEKLSIRLEHLRTEALLALGLPFLPLSKADRNKYGAAFSFAPPPLYVNSSSSSSSESDGGKGEVRKGIANKRAYRNRRKLDHIATSVRDAFIRFMCHPNILGGYAAFICNTDESDKIMFKEHRNAVTQVQAIQQNTVVNSKSAAVMESPNSHGIEGEDWGGRDIQEPDSPYIDEVSDHNRLRGSDLGFYEVFDAEGFIRCSPLHGKSLRRGVVGTQMFAMLVEERYAVNLARLKKANNNSRAQKDIENSTALFFERCIIECRKKAMEKKRKFGSSKIKLDKGEEVLEDKVKKTQARIKRKGKKSRRERSKDKGEEEDEVEGRNGVRGVVESAAKMVGGTGLGFGVGLLTGGPIGAIVGSVIGTGMSAAAVTAEKSEKKKDENQAEIEAGTRKVEPTIITRAMMRELMDGGKKAPNKQRKPILIPGTMTAGCGGETFSYKNWPVPLSPTWLDVQRSFVPPILLQLQKASVAEESLKSDYDEWGIGVLPPTQGRNTTGIGRERLKDNILSASGYIYKVSEGPSVSAVVKGPNPHTFRFLLFAFQLHFHSLPHHLSSRPSPSSSLRALLASLGLLYKMEEAVGVGIGGMLGLLDTEDVWRTLLCCVGRYGGQITRAIEKAKQKQKNNLEDRKRGREEILVLSAAQGIVKKAGVKIFQSMRVAGVSATPITLAHYMKSSAVADVEAEEVRARLGNQNNKAIQVVSSIEEEIGGRSNSVGSVGSQGMNRSLDFGFEGGARGSEYTSASVILNLGVGGLKSVGKMVGSEIVIFDTGAFNDMVTHGMKWLGAFTGSPGVLIEAASVLGDFGVEEEEARDGSFGVEGLKLEGMKVPPSTPVRGGAGKGGGEGVGGKKNGFFRYPSVGIAAGIASEFGGDEEAIFACQPMWCYKRCHCCGLAPLDEEIMARWEGAKEKVLSACEIVRRRAGISGEGRRSRRRRRTYESDQTVGGEVDFKDAAVEAAKEAAKEATREAGATGKGNALSMDVTVKIPCPNCEEPYEPELFFTTMVGVEHGWREDDRQVEAKELETSAGSVPYLPPLLLFTMWESISHLHGLVNSSSPLWLLGNGYRAFWGNWCWYNARHPDIPRHVLAPKVVTGWKEVVAKGKARGAISGGDGKVEVEEMFESESESEGSRWKGFLDKIKQAVALGGGKEVMELVRKAANGLSGGKGGVPLKNWREKFVYIVLLQISGHYGLRDMEVVSSLDLLTVKPRVEEVWEEGEGDWIWRSVFGHLY